MGFNKETGMYEGYIYKIVNDVNGDMYIGQTLQTIKKRWKQHINDSKVFDYYLYRAMRKYGEKHFNIFEIEKHENEDKYSLSKILDGREIYWISYYDTYNNGYNHTIGGQNNAPNKFLEREIIEYSMDCEQLYIYKSEIDASDATGFSRSDISSCCSRKKVYRVQNRIFRYKDSPLRNDEVEWYKLKYPKILQYDYNGNLLNTFDFIQDAVDFLNKDKILVINGNISACCKGKVLSAGGYVWRKYPDKFNTYQTPNILKKIEKRDVSNGELLETFTSISEINKKYNYDSSSIMNCCNGRSASSNGYHWCYENEFNAENLKRIRFKQISQYSLEGKLIKNYDSAYKAAEELNLSSLSSSASILAVCNGVRRTAYDFVWRYINDDFKLYDIRNYKKIENINKYINGRFVETFNSLKDAANSVGTTCKQTIRDCCNHLRKEYKGAEWFYVSDTTQPDKSKIIV